MVADNVLQRACEKFVSEALSPKVREQTRRAADKVRRELTPHFTDPSELARAVEGSSVVRTFRELDSRVRITTLHGGVAGYARDLLQAWDDSEKLESSLK